MIAEKVLCIALCVTGAVALAHLSRRGFWSLVLHLVARRLRNERKARKRLDVTKILESRK